MSTRGFCINAKNNPQEPPRDGGFPIVKGIWLRRVEPEPSGDEPGEKRIGPDPPVETPLEMNAQITGKDRGLQVTFLGDLWG